jgi:hypothetical protein
MTRHRTSPFAGASWIWMDPPGPIRVQWRRLPGRDLLVEANGPRSLDPVLSPWREAPVREAIYNGRRLRVKFRHGRCGNSLLAG